MNNKSLNPEKRLTFCRGEFTFGTAGCLSHRYTRQPFAHSILCKSVNTAGCSAFAGLQEDWHQEGQPGGIVPWLWLPSSSRLPKHRPLLGGRRKERSEKSKKSEKSRASENREHPKECQASVDRLAPSRALLQGLALFHSKRQAALLRCPVITWMFDLRLEPKWERQDSQVSVETCCSCSTPQLWLCSSFSLEPVGGILPSPPDPGNSPLKAWKTWNFVLQRLLFAGLRLPDRLPG